MDADGTKAKEKGGGGCPFSSDAARKAYASQTQGAPRVEFPPGETPYVSYTEAETLLSLQHPRTSAPTEPSFVIMSQVKELLFKLLHTELNTVCDFLRADKLDDALWTFRRVSRVQHYLLQSWEVVGAMTAVEFAEFRDMLGEASGFQSYSYRKLEFLLGNKNSHMVKPHQSSPAYDGVKAQLHAPSLYDVVLEFLHRQGMDLPDDVLRHDVTVPRQPHPAVEAVWRRIYSDPVRYRALYMLAEALLDTDELFVRWRQVHLVIVQRTLGAKPGTGGTYGVEWLQQIIGHRFFPELWAVRSTL